MEIHWWRKGAPYNRSTPEQHSASNSQCCANQSALTPLGTVCLYVQDEIRPSATLHQSYFCFSQEQLRLRTWFIANLIRLVRHDLMRVMEALPKRTAGKALRSCVVSRR